MATDSGFGKVKFFDDFMATAIDSVYTYDIDTDRTAWAITAGTAGGIVTCATTTNGDLEKIAGGRNWIPGTMGTIIFEARVRLNTSITQGCFVGLSDDNTTDEIPIDLDTGTLTTAATDAVGFVYDSQEDGNWYMCSVKNGVDGAQTSCAVGPTVDTFQTLRIVLEANGDASFYIDGKYIGSRTACVTTTVSLCPHVDSLGSGTASGMGMDYLYVEGGRV